MNFKDKYRLVDKINHRIKATINKFNLNEKQQEIVKSELAELVPNSDMLTKNGYISLSKKSLENIDENLYKSLESNLPKTVTEYKEAAIESLEDSGMPSTPEDIIYEVKSMITVTDSFDDLLEEWYGVERNLDVMVTIENPVMNEMSEWLYSKGQKSYGEMQWFIDNVNELKNKGVI